MAHAVLRAAHAVVRDDSQTGASSDYETGRIAVNLSRRQHTATPPPGVRLQKWALSRAELNTEHCLSRRPRTANRTFKLFASWFPGPFGNSVILLHLLKHLSRFMIVDKHAETKTSETGWLI